MCFLGLTAPGLLGLVFTPEKLKLLELLVANGDFSALPLVVGAGEENENPPELLEVVVVAVDPKLKPDDELVAAPDPNLNPPPAPMVMTVC